MPELLMYGSWHVAYQRPHHFARLFHRCGVKTHILTKRALLQKCPAEFRHEHLATSVRYIRGFPVRSRFTQGLTKWFVTRQERAAFHAQGDNTPAILYCVPRSIPETARPLVFDCIDDFTAFGHRYDRDVALRQERLAQKADLIWATSRRLFDHWQEQFPKKVCLVPNGADVDHFASAVRCSPELHRPWLAGRRALVGYCGAISRWFDLALVTGVAQKLRDIHFVLVGPVYAQWEHRWPENVTLLGAQPYAALPQIVKECDCCIIPFIVNNLTNATNPVKLFEYFAAGKPVVSTPLAEVHPYQGTGILEMADSVDGFAAAIETLIGLSYAEEMVKKRRLIAQQNSWETRFETACRTMQPFLPDGWPTLAGSEILKGKL